MAPGWPSVPHCTCCCGEQRPGCSHCTWKAAAPSALYGPLTAFIALLLWANLTAVALFYGIAFAAQLEAARAGIKAPAHPDPGPGD